MTPEHDKPTHEIGHSEALVYMQKLRAENVSLIAQVEALTVPQGSIGAQEFLKWNRSQPIPLVAIPMEMGVYRKAIEIYKALSNSPEIDGIVDPTIPAIPGTKEGA